MHAASMFPHDWVLEMTAIREQVDACTAVASQRPRQRQWRDYAFAQCIAELTRLPGGARHAELILGEQLDAGVCGQQGVSQLLVLSDPPDHGKPLSEAAATKLKALQPFAQTTGSFGIAAVGHTLAFDALPRLHGMKASNAAGLLLGGWLRSTYSPKMFEAVLTPHITVVAMPVTRSPVLPCNPWLFEMDTWVENLRLFVLRDPAAAVSTGTILQQLCADLHDSGFSVEASRGPLQTPPPQPQQPPRPPQQPQPQPATAVADGGLELEQGTAQEHDAGDSEDPDSHHDRPRTPPSDDDTSWEHLDGVYFTRPPFRHQQAGP